MFRSVKVKLTVAFLVISFLTILIALISYRSQDEIVQSQNDVKQKVIPNNQLVRELNNVAKSIQSNSEFLLQADSLEVLQEKYDSLSIELTKAKALAESAERSFDELNVLSVNTDNLTAESLSTVPADDVVDVQDNQKDIQDNAEEVVAPATYTMTESLEEVTTSVQKIYELKKSLFETRSQFAETFRDVDVVVNLMKLRANALFDTTQRDAKVLISNISSNIAANELKQSSDNLDVLSREFQAVSSWAFELYGSITILQGAVSRFGAIDDGEEATVAGTRFKFFIKDIRSKLRNAILEEHEDILNKEIKDLISLIYAEGDAGLVNLKVKEIQTFNSLVELKANTNLFSSLLSEKATESLKVLDSRLLAGVEEVGSNIAKSRKTINISAFGAFAIGLLITIFYVNRSLLRRLKQLRDNMTDLASGNYDIDIKANSKDEIGEMASAVVVFRDNLQKSDEMKRTLSENFKQNVFSIITEAKANVNELSDNSTQMNRVVAETSQQTSNVSENTEVCAEASEIVGFSMTQMVEAIKEIEREVLLSKDNVTNTVEMAKETKALVSTLIEASKKVENAFTVISNIAQQTNLLSLNAAIEAARAGDSGRGFAVVANEVKDLSTDVEKSTLEVRDVVLNMQKSCSLSSDAIDKILSRIDKIEMSSTAIASSVVEQASVSEGIQTNVEDVIASLSNVKGSVSILRQSAEETAASSGNVSVCAENLVNIMDQIETVSTDFALSIEKY